ncbi:MAG TPA: hypothetical protein VIK89_11935 [Cytophagaceae bacterium]
MKKDIPFLPVEGVCIAITRQLDEINNPIWEVHLINNNDFNLQNILVSSKGYGTKDGEEQKTSVLRHHIPELGPKSTALIEPIDPAVFHLYNEYWLSYFIDHQIFDKKFIFVPDTIIEENLVYIPILDQEGILHR